MHRTDVNIPKGNVIGRIDWERRAILMKMHDATHIVAGAARKILGKGAWQAGAQKNVIRSRLDITHFKPFTGGELEKIEGLANQVVRKNLEITYKFMQRKEAEGKYGFVLYQGGASPGKEVRVVEIKGHDVEACGGTHGFQTRDVGLIKIVRAERIQDGVNRIEFTAGERAREYVREMEGLYGRVSRKLGIGGKDRDKVKALQKAAEVFSVDVAQLENTVEKFLKGVGRPVKGRGLAEAAREIFSAWKEGRKEKEKSVKERALGRVADILGKAKGQKIFDVIPADRKELIQIAGEIIRLRPEVTVILANTGGDVVGMSRREDMGSVIREICRKAGGSGGGKGQLGQGKAPLSRLRKVMETYK